MVDGAVDAGCHQFPGVSILIVRSYVHEMRKKHGGFGAERKSYNKYKG